VVMTTSGVARDRTVLLMVRQDAEPSA
jgi:hypothetical protein